MSWPLSRPRSAAEARRTVIDLGLPSVTVAEVTEGAFQVVDVRSPSEFAEGHMPGALSHPLLDDEQRHVVGIAYKQEGAVRARMAALEEISAGLPAYLAELTALGRSQPPGRRLAVMCWRGGERSRNVVLLLALVGVHAVAVAGGYRAYRREVLSGLAGWCPPLPVLTLYGQTGAGKSALLRALASMASEAEVPRLWALDLEELALHRGSLLGGVNQPGERSQKDFDAVLWDRLRVPCGDYLVLEGESARIGQIQLPAAVGKAIRGGVPVLVRSSLEERTARIVREYSPDTWSDVDIESFRRALGAITGRVSRNTVVSLERAFDDGRFTDVVKGLLVEYYDPLYQKSCVDGRGFALEFETGPDPIDDAQRFVRSATVLMRGRPSSCCA